MASSGDVQTSNINELQNGDQLYVDDDRIRRTIKSQEHTSGELQSLYEFLNEPSFVTANKDPKTNIIDQRRKKTYNLPTNRLAEYFYLLEKCRRKQILLSYSEKQLKHSGIMLDFDFFQKERARQIKDEHLYHFTSVFATMLSEHLQLNNPCMTNAEGYLQHKPHEDNAAHMTFVYIIKPKLVHNEDLKDPEKNGYKDGFHLKIPDVQITRETKAYIQSEILKRGVLEGIFDKCEFLHTHSKMLDLNSKHVPVLFEGNNKPSASYPYEIHVVYDVAFKFNFGSTIPIVTKSHEFEVPFDKDVVHPKLKRGEAPPPQPEYPNISWEFSLNYNNPQGKLKKRIYEVKENFTKMIADYGNNVDIHTDDTLFVERDENDISVLGLADPNARYLRKIIDILSAERANEYESWFKIICILANTSTRYKRLAHYFSRKSAKYDSVATDRMWESGLEGRGKNKVAKIGTLYYMARCDNPEKYKELQKVNIINYLNDIIMEKKGKLGHFPFGKIIHMLLEGKFIFDKLEARGSKAQESWYEFILPDEKHIEGEPYKWRFQTDPDNMKLYLAEAIPKLFPPVFATLKKYIDQHADSDKTKAKYYRDIFRSTESSKNSLDNTAFQNGVIAQAKLLFRQYGFIKKLDMNSNVMGVGNGLLVFTKSEETFITSYHDYPVSKFTTTTYVPYDAENPYVKTLEDAMEDMIPEADAREYIMCFLGSSLRAVSKTPLILLLVGGGQNGKSFLLEMMIRTLSEDYAQKMRIEFLIDQNVKYGGADENLMDLKYARFVYFSEPPPNAVINMSRVKEVTGQETLKGRHNYGHNESFRPKTNYVSASNFDYAVPTTDHGTWRRLRRYEMKVKFCAHPNPNNPYEKQEKPEFSSEYVDDPNYRSAWLAILIKYLYIFEIKYNSSLGRIPCPTIDRETQIYRESQDTVARFIRERVVESTRGTTYSLNVIAEKYSQWYAQNIRDIKQFNHEVIEQIKNCSLAKYLRRDARGTALVGFRILEKQETLTEQQLIDEKTMEPHKQTLLTMDQHGNQLADVIPVDQLEGGAAGLLSALNQVKSEAAAQDAAEEELPEKTKKELVDDAPIDFHKIKQDHMKTSMQAVIMDTPSTKIDTPEKIKHQFEEDKKLELKRQERLQILEGNRRPDNVRDMAAEREIEIMTKEQRDADQKNQEWLREISPADNKKSADKGVKSMTKSYTTTTYGRGYKSGKEYDADSLFSDQDITDMLDANAEYND
jgi:phage/plasmid-associated DNA primase